MAIGYHFAEHEVEDASGELAQGLRRGEGKSSCGRTAITIQDQKDPAGFCRARFRTELLSSFGHLSGLHHAATFCLLSHFREMSTFAKRRRYICSIFSDI